MMRSIFCLLTLTFSCIAGPVLTGSLVVKPTLHISGNPEAILPGSNAKLCALVENIGDESSSAGEVFVRFAFPEQLKNDKKSVLYTSEKQPLPSLNEKQEIVLSFKTLHKWPTFEDFFRYHYGLRSYQLIALIDGREHLLAELIIAPSGHYYPGHAETHRAVIPKN